MKTVRLCKKLVLDMARHFANAEYRKQVEVWEARGNSC